MKKLTNIEDYNYHLPEEKIALFPCTQRDESKLLVLKNHNITETSFKQIPNFLPEESLLIFNDTKVVQARILLQKPNGVNIEVFCLEPLLPSSIHAIAFEAQEKCQWLCYIGNNKRFKEPIELEFTVNSKLGKLKVERIEQKNDAFVVAFSWTPAHLSFAQVLDAVGKIPLPPYIKRSNQAQDNERYQTIFAKEKGSVAAPTAGLHFTEKVFENIEKKGITCLNITLHVGAGTFKPVTEQYIENHQMHSEQLFFPLSTLETLVKNIDKQIIAVGTTTTRSLESLYWMGVQLLTKKKKTEEQLFCIQQFEPYQIPDPTFSKKEALEALVNYLKINRLTFLHASTTIMITPYYKPKIVQGLITNFHQPKSTLMLLISSFIGNDWKKVYQYALEHDFRFLSYGDACLFL